MTNFGLDDYGGHKKDFIYQKDIDTPGEMLYINCLWIGRRKIDPKKIKTLGVQYANNGPKLHLLSYQ